MKGSIQGSPADVAAKALHKYGAKFRHLNKVSINREGQDDTTVHEGVVTVVSKVGEAKDLATLVAIHKKHGEHALSKTHEMFMKEHKLYTKMVEQVQELPLRAGLRKLALVPQTKRVQDIEADMEFCDQLILDIIGLPQGVRKVQVKAQVKVKTEA